MTTTRELNVILRELERENKMGAEAYRKVMAELNARYEREAAENNARRVKMWWRRFAEQDNARRTQPHYA